MKIANTFAIARAFLACAFALMSTVVLAQAPAPLPQPNLPLTTNGIVYAVAEQSDGSVIVGGDFTEIAGVARSNLARFLPDGSFDENWTASTDGPVHALAVGADDSVFVGGLFVTAGGEGRSCLAKFSASGAVDQNWAPLAIATVRALAVADDGSVFVGGYFTVISGEPRNHLAKLSGSGAGALDENWTVSTNSRVYALATDSAGALYVAGSFASIGGQSLPYLAKVSSGDPATVDTAWTPTPNGPVTALRLDGNGQLYVGGTFESIGGASRGNLARLSASGSGSADAWNPQADQTVSTIALGADDSVYVGGFFHAVGGGAHEHVAKLQTQAPGDAIDAWHASTDGRVWAMILDQGGRVHLGGWFSSATGSERHSLAQVSTTSGDPGAVVDATEAGKAFAFALQPNGGAIVGGRFFAAGGQPRQSLFRMFPDGTLDPDWTPSVAYTSEEGAAQIGALAVDAQGDVYVGGNFDQIDGQSRGFLAKISGSGSGALDASWNPTADDYVDALLLDGSGSIYAGGYFTEIGGVSRNYLARMSAAGAGDVDAVWDPSADYYVYTISRDAQGAVYVGGDFSTVGGQPRSYAAKLSPDGAGDADPDWDPAPDLTVFSLVPDNQGSVFVGGWFFSIGGESRGGLAKLDAHGVADPTWNPATSPLGAAVMGMALDGDALYVGGQFDELGGIPIDSLAKLSTSGAGNPDPNFNPGVNGGPNGSEGLLHLTVGNGVLYASGGFTTIGGESRHGIAALPIERPDSIFMDGFDGSP